MVFALIKADDSSVRAYFHNHLLLFRSTFYWYIMPGNVVSWARTVPIFKSPMSVAE